jgi:hypothetical protein
MKKAFAAFALFAGFLLSNTPLIADQVIMQNGDTYNGKVVSMTTNSLVLQNDNLGNVTLPRAKITGILLGTGTATGALPKAPSSNIVIVRQPAATETNSPSDLAAALQSLRDQTNLIQQVQGQVLGSANPAAVNKFNEMLDELGSGKMDMNDLRAQAKAAADQLRSLGPGASEETDDYLSILDSFLQETDPTNSTANTATQLKPGG